MKGLLKSYQRKLTNLSTRNRSLVLLRPSSSQNLDLSALDHINHRSAFNFIEQIIAKKSKISLCPVVDNRSEAVNRVSHTLKKVSNYEKLIRDERGAHDLHIGWPFVEGKFLDGKIVRCPLLLFPVRLFQEDNLWTLSITSQATFNKNFLLAYAYFNKQPLSHTLDEFDLDELSTDSRVFRTELYNLLKESTLNINFNQELFTDKIKDFPSLTKATFNENFNSGGLKLQPYAIMGIFPQADSYLNEDFDKLIEINSFEGIEDFFLKSSLHEDNLKTNREEQFFTPFAIDSSQEQAIREAKLGRSIVIQGPPGTGKSQVICNIVSDFIARGKRF